jgi:hypothetical protein
MTHVFINANVALKIKFPNNYKELTISQYSSKDSLQLFLAKKDILLMSMGLIIFIMEVLGIKKLSDFYSFK